MAATWDHVMARLAEDAYNGYGEDAKWKTFDGRPMPKWGELPEATQAHWRAAMMAIFRPVKPFLPLVLKAILR